MCEFISWIDVQKDGEVHHLFLTDAEVYDDSHGREVFGDCKDNDVLGHGAIRKYYNLRLSQGIEHEARDFWKARLPPEITQKLADFDRNWGRMFHAGAFQNDDLRYLVSYAPEPYKAKAAEQLLKQKPSNDDLRFLVAFAPEPYKAKAWEQLLKQKMSNDSLCCLVAYAPEPYKAKAAEQLLSSTRETAICAT